MIRDKFLSLNDIRRQRAGFQFYTKDGMLLELVSVKEETIPVAYGFLGDMYQKRITVTVIKENGETLNETNLTSKTNGGNIYNIAYIEKNWDKLDFITVESFKENKKEKKTVSEGLTGDAALKSMGWEIPVLERDELSPRDIYFMPKCELIFYENKFGDYSYFIKFKVNKNESIGRTSLKKLVLINDVGDIIEIDNNSKSWNNKLFLTESCVNKYTDDYGKEQRKSYVRYLKNIPEDAPGEPVKFSDIMKHEYTYDYGNQYVIKDATKELKNKLKK